VPRNKHHLNFGETLTSAAVLPAHLRPVSKSERSWLQAAGLAMMLAIVLLAARLLIAPVEHPSIGSTSPIPLGTLSSDGLVLQGSSNQLQVTQPSSSVQVTDSQPLQTGQSDSTFQATQSSSSLQPAATYQLQ